MDLETFVENAKAICKAKGISVSAACLDAGLSISWLSDIENKSTRPRIDTVFAFAQYLGVTVSELIGEASSNVSELNTADRELLNAYHRATADDQQAVSLILNKYREKENASQIG